jgi:hypothetical protein
VLEVPAMAKWMRLSQEDKITAVPDENIVCSVIVQALPAKRITCLQPQIQEEQVEFYYFNHYMQLFSGEENQAFGKALRTVCFWFPVTQSMSVMRSV